MTGIADWFLATLLCVLLVEVALRLPFRRVIGRVVRTLERALHVFRAKSVSDHWKEIAMLAYAATTFRASVELAGLLVFLAVVAVVSTLAFEQLSESFAEFLTGWLGALYTFFIACLYVTLQKVVFRGRIWTSRPSAASAGLGRNADRAPEL